MRNQNYIIISIALLICCNKTNVLSTYPELCSVMNTVTFESINQQNILTAANQLETGYVTDYKGVQYAIALNQHNRIKFISTTDLKFRIDELFVGLEYSQIKDNIKFHEKYYSGWGYIVELTNGWKVMFYDSLILSNHKIFSESKIKSFYIEATCN